MQISAAPQINKLVPNALTSLSWAVNEYRNSNNFHPVSDEDGSRLISTLLDKKTDADLTQLFAQTAANAAVSAATSTGSTAKPAAAANERSNCAGKLEKPADICYNQQQE